MFSPQSQGRYKIDVDENNLLRLSKSQQANYYSTLLQKGVLSINEVRNELGYESIDGGNKHVIPFSDVAQNTINNSNTEEKENEGTEGN